MKKLLKSLQVLMVISMLGQVSMRSSQFSHLIPTDFNPTGFPPTEVPKAAPSGVPDATTYAHYGIKTGAYVATGVLWYLITDWAHNLKRKDNPWATAIKGVSLGLCTAMSAEFLFPIVISCAQFIGGHYQVANGAVIPVMPKKS